MRERNIFAISANLVFSPFWGSTQHRTNRAYIINFCSVITGKKHFITFYWELKEYGKIFLRIKIAIIFYIELKSVQDFLVARVKCKAGKVSACNVGNLDLIPG